MNYNYTQDSSDIWAKIWGQKSILFFIIIEFIKSFTKFGFDILKLNKIRSIDLGRKLMDIQLFLTQKSDLKEAGSGFVYKMYSSSSSVSNIINFHFQRNEQRYFKNWKYKAWSEMHTALKLGIIIKWFWFSFSEKR